MLAKINPISLGQGQGPKAGRGDERCCEPCCSIRAGNRWHQRGLTVRQVGAATCLVAVQLSTVGLLLLELAYKAMSTFHR